MTGFIMVFWKSWSAELKVIAAIVPVHVVEESPDGRETLSDHKAANKLGGLPDE